MPGCTRQRTLTTPASKSSHVRLRDAATASSTRRYTRRPHLCSIAWARTGRGTGRGSSAHAPPCPRAAAHAGSLGGGACIAEARAHLCADGHTRKAAACDDLGPAAAGRRAAAGAEVLDCMVDEGCGRERGAAGSAWAAGPACGRGAARGTPAAAGRRTTPFDKPTNTHTAPTAPHLRGAGWPPSRTMTGGAPPLLPRPRCACC